MANDDMRRELEALRAQVAELAANRAGPVTEPEIAMEADSSVVEEIEKGLGELSELLETELRTHPTATALAVFALGVVVGRLLR